MMYLMKHLLNIPNYFNGQTLLENKIAYRIQIRIDFLLRKILAGDHCTS